MQHAKSPGRAVIIPNFLREVKLKKSVGELDIFEVYKVLKVTLFLLLVWLWKLTLWIFCFNLPKAKQLGLQKNNLHCKYVMRHEKWVVVRAGN